MRTSQMKKDKESRQYQSDLEILQENLKKLNRSNISTVVNSIHALNPRMHDRVVPLIATVIPVLNDHETLVGFGYLIDCLIGMPQIASFLESQLVNFYCSIFRSLVNQKHYEGVNELKVMRKYWLGRIHPHLYAQMRNMIYEQMRINIDYVPEHLINDIYNHYLHFLRMDPKNIIVHLPQLNCNPINKAQETQINQNKQKRKQLQDVNKSQQFQVYQAKSCRQFKENIDLNVVQMRQSSAKIKNDEIKGINEKRQVFERMAVLSIKSIKNQQGDATQQLQKQFEKTQRKTQNTINVLKRTRNDSQQTTISIKLTKKWRGQNTSIQIPQSSRRANQNTQLVESKRLKRYQTPRKKYKSDPIPGFSVLFCEQCHICGLKILSKRLLNEHLSRHKSHNNPDPVINLQNSVVITFDNFMKYPDCCTYCNKGFNPLFYDGNWIFRNCVIRIIYEIQYVMHPQCSLLVQGDEVYPKIYLEESQIQQEKVFESKDETELKDEKDISIEKSTLSQILYQFQQHQEVISISL